MAAVRAAADLATGYFDDLVEGVRYVASHDFVRWVLMLFAIVFVLIVAPSKLTPLMVVRSFPSDEQGNVLNLAVLEMAFSGGWSSAASSWRRSRRAGTGWG